MRSVSLFNAVLPTKTNINKPLVNKATLNQSQLGDTLNINFASLRFGNLRPGSAEQILAQRLQRPNSDQEVVYDIWPQESRNSVDNTRQLIEQIKQKEVPSYHFYDDNGSRIYRFIAGAVPDYTANKSDSNIWENQGEEIFNAAQADILAELGIGAGYVTRKVILPQFLEVNPGKQKHFIGIDVSKEELKIATDHILKNRKENKFSNKNFDVTGIAGLNHQALNSELFPKDKSKMFTIIASSIGNYSRPEFNELLQQLHKTMTDKDTFALSVDWAPDQTIEVNGEQYEVNKTEQDVRNAYNDSVFLADAAKVLDEENTKGKTPGTDRLEALRTTFNDINADELYVTEAFNLNMLASMNANKALNIQPKLELKDWQHNPGIDSGTNDHGRYFRATSGLKYMGDNPVTITMGGTADIPKTTTVTFNKGDILKNEISEKYYYDELLEQLDQNGFELKTDDSVWMSNGDYPNYSGILLLKKK